MVSEKPNNPLEAFLLLGKNVRGIAATQLVQQVTEAPNIFVFGELLQLDGIKDLEFNEDHTKYWKLLQLYAFGVFNDYKVDPNSFPQLNELQIKKLRLLTIVTFASKSKFVSYKLLQENLGMENMRNLEDLLIESVYAGILKGKLNQKDQRLEVDFVIGRDIQPHMIDNIIETLENWYQNCEQTMELLDSESDRANVNKELKSQSKKSTELQVENTKKLFRSQEAQQQLVEAESSSSQGVKNSKLKPSKTTLKTAVKPSSSRTK